MVTINAFNMNEDQKRAAVEEYIKLRKTMTAKKASQAVKLSPDTIYKYAERFGIADQVKLRQEKLKRKRTQTPTLISVPMDDEHDEPTPQKQVVVASAAAQKHIVVIMGDPESVKMALAAAFQMITGK